MSNIEISGLEGEVIDGRYKIGAFLGKGTMGVVYEAEHILMKKPVAIKMLHPSHTRDREVVQRFRQEAQAAANIEHPNICSATDFGMYDSETYYLVMELLDGKSLSEIMEVETIGPDRAIHITKQILSALNEAHKVGVVHRDLKPENILIVERGGDPDCAKVTDFGVAQVRLFKDAQRITQVGMVYGSPLYMSPEQAQGEEVDHRADLYSIGIMLYEMLMGSVPFYARSLNVVLSMHVSDLPKPFAEIEPEHEIVPEFEALVMKLLQKEPDDRFQSATEVFDALSLLEKPGLNQDFQSQPAEKSRILRFAIPIVATLVLISLAIILTRDESVPVVPEDEKTLVFVPQEINLNKQERVAFLESIGEAELPASIASDPEASLEKINGLIETTPDSSHLHYLLGKTLLGQKAYPESIASFEKAVELNGKYAADSALLDDTFKILERRKWKDAKHAHAFILGTLKENATARLAEVSEHHRSARVRKRGLKLLEEAGLFASLEKWNQLTISLRHAISCEDNQALIVQIGELGEPKALGSLRRFSSNPKTGCKGEDCWKCARNDVRISIEKLSAK